MKTILLLCAVVAAALARPEEFYSSQYDSFNAQELVENTRLLKNYAKCFLDQGPCTSEGSDFKKLIPEAVKTKCVKCSPKQRELIRTMIHGFQERTPDLWEQLIKKNDPKGEYKDAIDDILKGSK